MTNNELAEKEYPYGNQYASDSLQKDKRAAFIRGLEWKGGDWISVKKQLPEPHEEVLATNEYDKWVVIAILKRTRWFNSHEAHDDQPVAIFPTHWMPLPQPPKIN